MPVLPPDAFEAELARYLYERAEEARAVRVGEKETSEQAAIVARYAGLFTREQHDALREGEAAASGAARERLFRLLEACAGGIVAAELAERADALENAILACRVDCDGESLPLRAAQARLAVLDPYAARDRLGGLVADASATFNSGRLELLRAGEALDAELSGEPDPVLRSGELKGIDLGVLAGALESASARLDGPYTTLRERWLDRLLGPDRDEAPLSAHLSYVRRLSPLAATYTKERAVAVCLETLAALGFDLAADERIRLDLDDRPQKNPRACVIASDPPRVVHLITRAQGGLADYQAFLHEAGHALHYAGCDPDLPYAFRRLARDHALTEIYSFLVESVTHEPGWHALHFALDEATAAANAEATRFLDACLFRRYTAKLRYELGFWADFGNAEAHASEYERLVSAASGFRYPRSGFLADMDDGFYSADYLRAWIRAAQVRARLRRELGAGWWRRAETGGFLRDLFREGTRPSSEEVAARLGFDPLDTGPLVAELSG
ncbi:MAG: hypothetical protein IT201_10630 [Thermoleophilia bacterium]|nr:hypothetical protein [Thermoleophilia bacterium]